MDIKLNFINNSNDQSNSNYVVFSKNAATNFPELAVAWLVIKNCGQGDNHPFTFPMEQQVGVSDSYGNYTPRQNAENGQKFVVALNTSGTHLSFMGPASSNTEIQVVNGLVKGAVNAGIYKDGKLFAVKNGIAPAQMAVFSFKPTIWIGAVSQLDQGEVMNSAILSYINTEISLMGIASADIVVTGGGAGPDSRPFMFNLENINMA